MTSDKRGGSKTGRMTGQERTKARQAAGRFIARRKSIRLGALKIKDLINEGRP